MRLKSIRIKNFRSIKDDFEIVGMEHDISIVGPNSSGKTNVLKAIEMFFTGPDNRYEYNIKNDLTFDMKGGQTSIVATFTGDRESTIDREFYNSYDELNNFLEKPKPESNDIVLYLTFLSNGSPQYRFFPNEKYRPHVRREKAAEKQQVALSILLSQFSCYYIPSSKSIRELIDSLLIPFVKQSISSILEEKIEDINNELSSISLSITSSLEDNGVGNVKALLSIPNNSIENMISSFEFKLEDSEETLFYQKGMGIQTTSLLAALKWITDKENERGKKVIWLIEEPESFLHPQLYKSCFGMLKKLSNIASVFWTTHSISFINKDAHKIIGTKLEGNRTKKTVFNSYQNAVTEIQKALGIQFSDFYSLLKYNIFVEGKTDKSTFEYVLEVIKKRLNKDYIFLDQSCFLDMGGVSAIEGFLKAIYEFISKERVCVVIFDGDDAGVKVSRNLQKFFGNKKIAFQSNNDYIFVGKNICLEGLFPPEWVKELHKEHNDYFSTYSESPSGDIIEFSIEDDKKTKAQQFFMNKIENSSNDDWLEGFISIFDVLEKMIRNKDKKIYGE